MLCPLLLFTTYLWMLEYSCQFQAERIFADVGNTVQVFHEPMGIKKKTLEKGLRQSDKLMEDERLSLSVNS